MAKRKSYFFSEHLILPWPYFKNEQSCLEMGDWAGPSSLFENWKVRFGLEFWPQKRNEYILN